jgi:hypothetical protein
MNTMKQFDGVSAIALILIASFAIDRVVTAILFLLNWAGWVPDPTVDERKYKLIYFLLGGLLGIFVLAHFGKVRVMTALGIPIDPYLDTALTGIVLVGGADRIAGLLKAPGVEPPREHPQPMVISGKLVLEETAAQKVLGHNS